LGVIFKTAAHFSGSCLDHVGCPMIMAWKPAAAWTRLSAFSTPTTRTGDPMTKSINRSSVAIALLISLATISQAMAAQPTMQEKMACRTDAQTLCSQFIGHPPQMQACLAHNKAKLSISCRGVVEADGG
jgi:hypothetical protein